jgi:hypothetical protein
MYDVIRGFGVDYIYFDLAFLTIFIASLIFFKKKVPLLAFFIGGLLINFIIDWGIWLHTGVREISLPINSFWSVFIFFLWFSLSYGIEYAYVFLMFEGKKKLKWTLFVLIGWLAVAFLSQWLPINDNQIETIRHMSDFRFLEIGVVIVGFGLLFLLKYNWKKISFLFLIGFLIHFMMEFSLLVSGIRPGSLLVLLENSSIEFNMGIPFFYILWNKVLRKKSTPYAPPC